MLVESFEWYLYQCFSSASISFEWYHYQCFNSATISLEWYHYQCFNKDSSLVLQFSGVLILLTIKLMELYKGVIALLMHYIGTHISINSLKSGSVATLVTAIGTPIPPTITYWELTVGNAVKN